MEQHESVRSLDCTLSCLVFHASSAFNAFRRLLTIRPPETRFSPNHPSLRLAMRPDSKAKSQAVGELTKPDDETTEKGSPAKRYIRSPLLGVAST
jgi:hypothetical protein